MAKGKKENFYISVALRFLTCDFDDRIYYKLCGWVSGFLKSLKDKMVSVKTSPLGLIKDNWVEKKIKINSVSHKLFEFKL